MEADHHEDCCNIRILIGAGVLPRLRDKVGLLYSPHPQPNRQENYLSKELTLLRGEGAVNLSTITMFVSPKILLTSSEEVIGRNV